MAPTTRWSESVERVSRQQRVRAPGLKQRVRQPWQPQQGGWQPRLGFTLVELLVVVSIIALLISILLPSLKQAREQAKSVKCLAHSRGLGQASMTFVNDHDGVMQLATSHIGRQKADPGYSQYEYGTEQRAAEPKRELLAWPVALAQSSGMTGIRNNWDWGVRADGYSGANAAVNKDKAGLVGTDFELSVCPSDRVKLASPFYPRTTSQLFGPGDPDDPNGSTITGTTSYWGKLSYGINEDVVGADLAADPACWKNGHKGETGDSQAGNRLEGRIDRIFDPATVLLMIDAGRDSVAEDGAGFANLLISAQANGPFLEDFQARWRLRLPAKRHPKGQLNVTYTDGHGAPTKPVGSVMFGRTGPFPERFTNVTRISPYPPKNLTIP